MWLPICDAARLRRKTNAESEAEDGGTAEDGVDANEEAGGDAPGQLFGEAPMRKERKDGKSDAAVDPVVMNGSGVLAGVVGICFTGSHFLQDRLR